MSLPDAQQSEADVAARPVRLLFLGDVVGEAGRKIAVRAIPLLRRHFDLEVVVVNAENAAGGSGLNPRCFTQLKNAGVDAFTMGDHIYKKKEIIGLLKQNEPICKPANFPRSSPGPAFLLVPLTGGGVLAVISLLGRVFMRPVDCPFVAADRVLEEIGGITPLVLVDIHAEATSDKQLVGRYLAGRVSAVLGTHTHVPTADASIFPPGTAYQTDVGMTGPYDGIIGRRYDRVIHTSTTFEPTTFDVAENDARVSGAIVVIDRITGHALDIQSVHLTAEQLSALEQAGTT